jgi:hypothetical protein
LRRLCCRLELLGQGRLPSCVLCGHGRRGRSTSAASGLRGPGRTSDFASAHPETRNNRGAQSWDRYCTNPNTDDDETGHATGAPLLRCGGQIAKLSHAPCHDQPKAWDVPTLSCATAARFKFGSQIPCCASSPAPTGSCCGNVGVAKQAAVGVEHCMLDMSFCVSAEAALSRCQAHRPTQVRL